MWCLGTKCNLWIAHLWVRLCHEKSINYHSLCIVAMIAFAVFYQSFLVQVFFTTIRARKCKSIGDTPAGTQKKRPLRFREKVHKTKHSRTTGEYIKSFFHCCIRLLFLSLITAKVNLSEKRGLMTIMIRSLSQTDLGFSHSHPHVSLIQKKT